MSQQEFIQIVESLNGLSLEQMQQLRRELDDKMAASTPADHNDAGKEQQARQDMQRQLVEAGILSEIKPPITDMSAYRNRKAVPIVGEPLSETVIRERR